MLLWRVQGRLPDLALSRQVQWRQVQWRLVLRRLLLPRPIGL
ncbi:MAG TPA: hypothetical protein VF979_08545 [Streptosporangiaceae bacterium]